MSLRLGDTAPNFQASTTEGNIDFYEWMGDKWAVLFSHPKDYTPVCTTELGMVARIKSEFDKRNVKVIGVSVDPLESHKGWIGDMMRGIGRRWTQMNTDYGPSTRVRYLDATLPANNDHRGRAAQ